MKTKGKPMATGWSAALWIVAIPAGMALFAAGMSGFCYNPAQESLPVLDHMEAIFLWVLILTVPIGGFIAAAIVLRRKMNYSSPNQPSQPIAG